MPSSRAISLQDFPSAIFKATSFWRVVKRFREEISGSLFFFASDFGQFEDIADAAFGQNTTSMLFDRIHTDTQLKCNLLATGTTQGKIKDFLLPLGQ